MGLPMNLTEMILGKAIGAMGNEALGELFREIFAAKARGAVNLTPGEIIRDMFLEGTMGTVPDKKQLEVTKPVAATGGGAEDMIGRFSDPTPNTMRADNYDKITQMLGELIHTAKSLDERMTKIEEAAIKSTETPPAAKDKNEENEKVDVKVEEEEAEKALREEVTRAILTKGEEEEEEGGEEEEEEEMGKSLSDSSKVRFAKGFLAGARDAMAKSKEKGVRREAEKAVRKALALAKGAVENSKDKDVIKGAKDVLSATEEFMFLHGIAAKGKHPAQGQPGLKDKDKNQEKWPDHDGFEKSLVKLTSDVHGLMNAISNISRGKGMPGVETIAALPGESPIQKGGQNYFNDKVRLILEKADAGQISEADQGSAEELITLMQAVQMGRVPEAVIGNSLAMSNPAVRSLFPEWAAKG